MGSYACEMVLAVRGPASWAYALAADISSSGCAVNLIFSEISCLVGPGRGGSGGGVIQSC